MTNEVKGVFSYARDTKQMHCFDVTTEGKVAVTGTLYIPKDGPGIPARIVLVNPNHAELSE